MALTDTTIKNTKPGTKPRRLFDGGGLYLELSPSGGRWWRLKYRHGGKEKRLSLGTYPSTSLKSARDKRDEARRLLAEGTDPAQVRKGEKLQALESDARSFKAVALAWLKHNAARLAAGTRARALAAFEADAFPVLGSLRISEIRARQVKAVVLAVEKRGAGESADRLLQRVRAVFRYAVTEELIDTNPMLDLKAGEIKRRWRAL